jgi:hypothetical protein
MPKSTDACNSILALIFNGTAWANIAEDDSSSPLTSLWVSLHTTPGPGVGGSQLTNEATYGSYARKEIVRTTGGWEIPGAGATSNAAIAQFIEASSGPQSITHVAVGTDETGAGLVLYTGQLSSSRTIDSGIQPQFNENALVVQET